MSFQKTKHVFATMNPRENNVLETEFQSCGNGWNIQIHGICPRFLSRALKYSKMVLQCVSSTAATRTTTSLPKFSSNLFLQRCKDFSAQQFLTIWNHLPNNIPDYFSIASNNSCKISTFIFLPLRFHSVATMTDWSDNYPNLMQK